MDLSSSDCDHLDEAIDKSVDLISRGINRQLHLKCNDDLERCDRNAHIEEVDVNQGLMADTTDMPHKVHGKQEVHVDDHDDDDGDDDDFTFMLIGHDDDASSYDDKVFEDGQIRQVFPLFDQTLLQEGEYDIEEIDRLPVLPPVHKIFIESPRGFPSSTKSEYKANENEDVAAGPYCTWSKDSSTAAAELSKKSNSTGFSKLWRLKEKVGRSNSDGRDAFVFLKGSDRSRAATTKTSSSSKPGTSEGTFVKVNVAGGKARVVKQGTKGKKSTVSAHEAYLRSRGGHTEEERRRSYLPYKPELMGLFTNVHGGLTKNVHPY